MITLLLRSPFSRLNRNIFFLEKLSFATICAEIDNKKNTDKICVSVLIIHIMKTFKRLVELPRSSLFLSCSRRAATPSRVFFYRNHHKFHQIFHLAYGGGGVRIVSPGTNSTVPGIVCSVGKDVVLLVLNLIK